MAEDGTITIKKDDLWKYSTFALVAVLIIGSFFVFTGDSGSINGAVVGNDPNPQPSVVKASVDDDAILGDKNAPVTIIEFSDYQCPFCRKFWAETLPSIKEQYIDTGKVRFVYRDFPIPSLGHEMAVTLAEAAECVRDVAGNDEAYFKMHDKIFEEQSILDGGSKSSPVTKTVHGFSEDDIKSWAQDLGYNIDSCLDSGKFRSEVQKDLVDGQSAGIKGTPGFVINGKLVSGAQPFSIFQQIIEAELA